MPPSRMLRVVLGPEAWVGRFAVSTTLTAWISITFMMCSLAASRTALAISMARTGSVSVTVMAMMRVSSGLETDTMPDRPS